MKKIIVGLFMLVAHSSFAGGYVGDVVIDRIWVEGSGVMFGFKTTPADCAGSYAAAHARLSASTPNYKEMYSLLLAARLSGKSIDIWYTDNGDCTAQNTILTVHAVGIHVGQN